MIKMRLHWSRVGPLSNMTGVLTRRQPCEDRETQRECHNKCRDWCHSAIKSTPKIPRPEARKTRKVSLTGFRDKIVLPTP